MVEMVTEKSVRGKYGEEIIEKFMMVAKESVKLWVRKSMVAMSVKMDPPELGRVHMKTVMQDGKLGAVLHTETVAAKEIIQSQLQDLKDLLKSMGVEVMSFDVELRDHDKDTGDQLFNKKSNGSNFDLEDLLAEDEAELESKIATGLINKVA